MKFTGAAIAMVGMLATAGAAVAQTTLIYGEAAPNRGARAEAIQWFADQVAERSGGELSIDIQWGGALFQADAALQSIGDGVADLGTIIAVYYPQELVGYGIADLPLDNPDAWVGMRATDELMRTSEAMQAAMADYDLVYVGALTTSQVNIGCKGAKIETVDDIGGVKVRGVGAYGKVFGDLGANMVRMSIYDAYQGLDTGLIDCSQGYSYAVTALKQNEVIDSYTLLNWGQVGGFGIVMNKGAFDALEAEQQEILLQAGSDMTDYYAEILTAANDKAIEDMKAGGIEVVTMAEGERAKLVEQGKGYIDAWVETASAQSFDGKALLEEYQGLIAKYTKQRDDEGYPWAQ